MGPIGCLEASVRNYNYTLRYNPGKRSSWIHTLFNLDVANFYPQILLEICHKFHLPVLKLRAIRGFQNMTLRKSLQK
jgi:hypothetical protein